MEMPQVYRPIPRRTFEISPSSTESSHPPSPSPDSTNPELLTDGRGTDRSPPPSRTRSILNLTSSTLFGIYSPTGEEGTREELSTPWGTGAQTPSQRQSIDDYRPTKPPVRWNGETTKPHLRPRVRRKGFRAWLAPLALQTALLFTLGVGYGSIITHIQKTQQITPVPVPDAEHDSIWYHISWGIFGILLGNALPLVDTIWKNGGYASSEKSSTTGSGNLSDADSDEEESRSSSDSSLGPFWYSAVRSIGAFVGIAFAVVSRERASHGRRRTDLVHREGCRGNRHCKLP